MSLSFASASRAPAWRRAGSSLALAASLALAFHPSLLLAQVQLSDPDRPAPKVAPHAPAKKAVSRQSPTDNVSDDLNRRESERAEQAVRAMTASSPMAAPAVMQGNGPFRSSAKGRRFALPSALSWGAFAGRYRRA
ncbi:MAG TPA: hypothetical protein VLL30_20350 [Reyranella sp.]|nr:hypothetical protein [Reyranella sp.]